MHLAVYRRVPEAAAIVRTHSDCCVALACCGMGIPGFHYLVGGFGGDDIPGGIESARRTLELLSDLQAPRVRSEARVLLDVTQPYAHHPDVADLRHDLTQALPPGPGTTVA